MESPPLASLDDSIRGLEAERESSLRLLARTFRAIEVVDDKLFEARTERSRLVKRMERSARLAEITRTLHAIRAELATVGSDHARRAHLRQQGSALAAEAVELLANRGASPWSPQRPRRNAR